MKGNLSSKAKKMLQGLAIVSGVLLAVYSPPAYAVCSNPAGAAADMFYNTTVNVMQYCDDTNWIAMNQLPGSGAGGCSNPTGQVGSMVYNEDEHVVQVCAGNVWRGLGPPGGASINHWKQVEGAGGFACGIKNDNSLWCWGTSYLGDGQPSSTQYSPIKIGSAQWKMISLGNYIGRNACGIQVDDTLWCWGEDTYGQQGDGGTAGPQLSPHQIGVDTWKHIDTSEITSCGIKSNDTLWCWGHDGNGAVGDGAGAVNQTSPVQIGIDTWKFVVAGEANAHSCGIKTDDSLWCWGSDTDGQLGNGATTGNQYSPVAVAAGTSWKFVEVLTNTTCGIRTDDSLWCWGLDYQGTLGDGGGVNGSVNAPVAVAAGTSWRYIAGASLYHFCGIKTDDTAWCWGWNAYGMTGQGTENGNSIVPTQVSGGGTWIDLGAATTSTCGIKSDGRLTCWGVEFGEPVETDLPQPIAGNHRWQKIDTNGFYYDGWDNFACGIRTDGVMMCWGGNDYGQLGDNQAEEVAYSPVTVSGGYTWSDISAGDDFACGLRTNGVAMCWGRGTNGSLGNGTNTAVQPTPVTVSGGHTWTQISAEGYGGCGIRTDGVAMCWGIGTSGQLGNGANSNSNVPVTVSGGHTWQLISASGDHACGIRTDGVAMCWGDNGHHQLGDGTTNDSNVPVTVMGGHTWRYISAGYSGACGIRSDYVQMCWGWDEFWDDWVSPTVVSGADKWKTVQTGVSDPDTRCGVKLDNTGWCIGYYIGSYEDGYLGVYQPVAGGSQWKHISMGESFACGVTLDDIGYCWGEDWIGQLGYGGGGPTVIPTESTGCNGPLAEPGEIIYNTDNNVMQYCDGQGWVAIGK